MDARSVILVLGALSSCGIALAVGCTEPFFATGSGGSGSATGSAGAASTKSSASATTAVSSSGAPVPCNTDHPDMCPAGTYCFIPGCKDGGTCTAAEADAGAFSPVCSCDGVTYWNGLLAGEASTVVRRAGACDGDGETCDAGSTTCHGFGARAFCNVPVDGGTACGVGAVTGQPQGTCWVLPPCPGSAGEPHTGYACVGTGQCKTQCALIEAQVAWWETACTPQ
jgi:hypothetical protein